MKRLTLHMGTSQLKARLNQRWDANPNLQKASTVVDWHDKLPFQVFSKNIGACRAHRRIMQRKSTIQLGPWAPRGIQACEKRHCYHTNSSLLQSKKMDCFANRCKHLGSRSLLTTGPKTSLFCKQGFDWSTEGICCYRIGVLGCSLGNGKVSSLSIHKPLHSRNRPKAIWRQCCLKA